MSPLQIKPPDLSDIMLVEEHLRTRLHYMASPDVVLRYGDEDEFIPSMEYVAVPGTGSGGGTPVDEKADGMANPSPTSATPAGQAAKKGPTKKILQGRKMKGGRVVKGGIPPKIVTVNKEETNGSKPNGDGPTGEVHMKPRLNGSQLPLSWTMESANSRNNAVTLTYRHLVRVCSGSVWPQS
jgi:hypothetical protein